MKTLKNILQSVPVVMLVMYITLYFFTYSDFYADVYDTITSVDTCLLLVSIVGAMMFIEEWKTIPILSFITVVLLNLLTELSFRVEITYYYEIYLLFITLFFITTIIFLKVKK